VWLDPEGVLAAPVGHSVIWGVTAESVDLGGVDSRASLDRRQRRRRGPGRGPGPGVRERLRRGWHPHGSGSAGSSSSARPSCSPASRTAWTRPTSSACGSRSRPARHRLGGRASASPRPARPLRRRLHTRRRRAGSARPGALRLGCEQLGAAPERAVAIADSANGVRAGERRGACSPSPCPTRSLPGRTTLTSTVVCSLTELSCGSRQLDFNSTPIGRPASHVCQRSISIQAFTRGRSRWPYGLPK
jgi:hypothetical protein